MGSSHLGVPLGPRVTLGGVRVLTLFVFQFPTGPITWTLRMELMFIKGNKDTVMSSIRM